MHSDASLHGFDAWRVWIWRFALAGYLVFLVYTPVWDARAWGFSNFSFWQLQNAEHLRDWLQWLAWTIPFDVLRYMPLGILVAKAIGRSEGLAAKDQVHEPPGIPAALGHGVTAAAAHEELPPKHSAAAPDWRRVSHQLWAMVFAGALAVPTHMVEASVASGVIRPMPYLLPIAGAIIGAWIGVRWTGSFQQRVRAVAQLCLLAMSLGVVLMALVVLATEAEPLPFEPAQVTSEDKRRLVRIFQEKDPRDLEPGQIESMSLTSDDVDRLLIWGLSIGATGRKARVELRDGSAELHASVALPLIQSRARYVNVFAFAKFGIERGEIRIAHPRVRIGRIVIPSWVAGPMLARLTSTIERDQYTRPLLSAVEQVRIEDGRITMQYHRAELPKGFASDVFNRLRPGRPLRPAIRFYTEYLLSRAAELPEVEDRFEYCMREVFRLAAERSRDGDPVFENRAGIYALAILLGHHRVQSLVGYVLDERRALDRPQVLGDVPLRGRKDWTKHFWVSAAIALVSTEATSDAAGLLKEELDAGRGGSGFSFSDYLADRAGTTLALVATRDAESARTMQARLGDGFSIGEVFPEAADLPEGLSDALLAEQFGGVGGPGYLEMMAEIERRIAQCAAYRGRMPGISN